MMITMIMMMVITLFSYNAMKYEFVILSKYMCLIILDWNVFECIWMHLNVSERIRMYLNVSEYVWMHWFELVGRILVSWASARLMNWPSNCSPILYSALVLFWQNIIIAVKYTYNMLITFKVYKFCCHFVATFIYSFNAKKSRDASKRFESFLFAQCMEYRTDPSGVFFLTSALVSWAVLLILICHCHGTDKIQ